jgi:hypothetical protein
MSFLVGLFLVFSFGLLLDAEQLVGPEAFEELGPVVDGFEFLAIDRVEALETIGCGQPSRTTKSVTGISPSARVSRTCRRLGSATALKGSSVVAARGIWIIIFPYGNMSSKIWESSEIQGVWA